MGINRQGGANGENRRGKVEVGINTMAIKMSYGFPMKLYEIRKNSKDKI